MINKLPVILFLALTSGCASVKQATDSSYLSNEDRVLSFGNKDDSIGLFEYIVKNENGIDYSMRYYIDSLPFADNFDLCASTGYYSLLKGARTDVEGNTTAVYKDEKVDCNSFVRISQFKNGSSVLSFDLNFLDGFRKDDLYGFELLIPMTFHHHMENILIGNEEPQILEILWRPSDKTKETTVRIDYF